MATKKQPAKKSHASQDEQVPIHQNPKVRMAAMGIFAVVIFVWLFKSYGPVFMPSLFVTGDPNSEPRPGPTPPPPSPSPGNPAPPPPAPSGGPDGGDPTAGPTPEDLERNASRELTMAETDVTTKNLNTVESYRRIS